MEGAGAAEGDEREVARVVSAFDGDAAQGGFHVGVGYPQDGGRGSVRVTVEDIGDTAQAPSTRGQAEAPCGHRGSARR